jgi:hypothetical protein
VSERRRELECDTDADGAAARHPAVNGHAAGARDDAIVDRNFLMGECSAMSVPDVKLRSIAQSRTEPASRVERARILLAYREDPSFFVEKMAEVLCV